MPNNSTKLALEASLKNLLLKKPVDKITITDLTNDCGITRMAFYYHFKDIYDLVEWSCYEDASKALHGKKTYETWQEGLMQIFELLRSLFSKDHLFQQNSPNKCFPALQTPVSDTVLHNQPYTSCRFFLLLLLQLPQQKVPRSDDCAVEIHTFQAVRFWVDTH